MTLGFSGFHRSDGRIGIRNDLVIVSVVDLVNPIVRRMAAQLPDAVALTSQLGRARYGEDLELTLRTLTGLCDHPNVGACLVVGLNDEETRAVTDRVDAPLVRGLVVGDYDDQLDAAAAGVGACVEFAQDLARMKREPATLGALCIATQDGNSDATTGLGSNPVIGGVCDRVIAAGGQSLVGESAEMIGAEEHLASRAVSQEVADRILAIIQRANAAAMAVGEDVRGTNPGPENIAGGLSTLEEKSIGSVMKSGSAPITGALEYADRPGGPGLYVMDTPSPSVESVTGLIAAGAQLVLFSTGAGNPVASLIAPTIKVTANAETAQRRAREIDADVSPVLGGEETLADAVERLTQLVLAVAGGQRTAGETLSAGEMNVTRIGQSL